MEDNLRYTPADITSLGEDEIFVFGSNLAGYHAGGAARTAMERFGAVWGQGTGLQGRSYAIPTMQGGVETIKPYVDVGCGIAGFTDEEIAPLFAGALDLYNVVLPREFVEVLRRRRP